jgi:hypothetical protein
MARRGRGDGGAGGCSFEASLEMGSMLSGLGDGLGDEGGVAVDNAPSMMSGGGRDLEENITPGALVASRGGRDQMTQPPRSVCGRRGEGVEVDSVEEISSICERRGVCG